MAESAVFSVPATGAAVLIATGGESSETQVQVYNSGAVPVYLGGSNVTSTNGFTLIKSERITVSLAATEKLYVCATQASTVGVLVTSKGSIFAP